MRQYTEFKTADLFPDNAADVRLADPRAYELLQQLEDSILALEPANRTRQMVAGSSHDACWEDRRHALAVDSAGRTRNSKGLCLSAGFWLTLLFASFGLFAPRNLTSAVTLTLCAIAVAGAIGMILELEQGFGGLVHISPQPMRQALNTLQKELEAKTYE